MQLQVGEVKEIILPTDSRSLTGRLIEYRVDVQYKEASGPAAIVEYPNCIVASQFGSAADYFTYTLHSDPTAPKDLTATGVGSKVLLLCIRGDSALSYIVGAVREQETEDTLTGHHLEFEFNGVRVEINDSGEAKMTFRGKTKVDGTLDASANSEAEGAYIQLDKNGSIKIANPNDNQTVVIDHAAKTINIQADTETTLDCNGLVKIRSEGVHVGSATDAWMLGTTYRKAESAMHRKMISEFSSLSGLLSAAGQLIGIAGVTNKFSKSLAAGLFKAGGAALQAAGSQAGKISGDIAKFESKSNDYLSKKNLTD